MSNADVTQQDVESFERDGALCLRGAFAPRWIEAVARGIEKELAAPGERFIEQQQAGQPGRFVTAYCAAQHIGEVQDFVVDSPAAEIFPPAMRPATAGLPMGGPWVKE